MFAPFKVCFPAIALLFGIAGNAAAQQANPLQPSTANGPITAPVPGDAIEGAKPAGKLVLLFDTGAAALGARNEAVLDKAARLYTDGKPVIMIVTGGTDSVGTPENNLLLSQRRATMVVQGMIARGIPAERTQILAKGETNPVVQTGRGVAEAQNRRVEITWR